MLKLIQESIEFHLEGLRDEGKPTLFFHGYFLFNN
jgi:predicted RNase H-like HicB family nuclease